MRGGFGKAFRKSWQFLVREPKWLWIFAAVLVVINAGLFGGIVFGEKQTLREAELPVESSEEIKSYFSYSDDNVKELSRLQTDKVISWEEIHKVNSVVYDFIAKEKMVPTVAAKLYAYLAVAERDAVAVSIKATGKPSGSIEPVVKEVACLLIAEECEGLGLTNEGDSYSKGLASLVLAKVKERDLKEKEGVFFPTRLWGEGYWEGEAPITPESGSWQPWLIDSALEFVPSPPLPYGSAEDLQEIELTKAAVAGITKEQREKVILWAGIKGSITPAGIWLSHADQVIWENNLSLTQGLFIRSNLAMAIADSFIVCWKTKYTYWTARPNMRDRELKTIIPTPPFPSFPSGHSTVSATAATVLSYYFPEKREVFFKMAEEARDSRLWAGIHFPQDNQVGFTVGEKVGRAVVKKLR